MRLLALRLAVWLVIAGLWAQVDVAEAQWPRRQYCRLELRLEDGESGAPHPGVVSVMDESGKVVPLGELLPRGLGVPDQYDIHDWWVVVEPVTVRVPRQRLTIRAFSGIETEMTTRPVDCRRERASVEVPLVRIANPAAEGWVNGNTHLHLQRVNREQSDRYLVQAAYADGLDLVFVTYLEREGPDTTYITNQYSFDELRAMSNEHVHYRGGQELRHAFQRQPWVVGYGHVMLLNLRELIRPVSIGPGLMQEGTDALPLKVGLEEARRQGGAVIWAHNDKGTEDIANYVMGRIDANNIFDGGSGTDYDRSFYRYLNAGMRVPFSTGTDWFIYDFARVYVKTPEPFTPEQWLADLSAGRSFITNGPLLDFTLNGRELGDALDLTKPGSVPARGRAVGRVDFRRIELVQNGKVVATASTRPEGGHYVAELTADIEVSQPSWFALRTPSPLVPGDVQGDADVEVPLAFNEFSRGVFSHTSAIYVTIAGEERFDVAVAEGLLAEMKENREEAMTYSVFGNAGERERVRAVYDEGIVELERRIASVKEKHTRD